MFSAEEAFHTQGVFENSEQHGNLNEWLDAVADHLREHDVDVSVEGQGRRDPGAALVISAGGKRHKLAAQITPKASAAMVAALAANAKDHRVLLVTDHLGTATIQACRSLGLACADLDGNMYLHLGAVHLDVEGRARTLSKDLVPVRGASSALTTRSGVQVLFVVLAAPASVDLPMRDLAAASGTSLGSVSTVFRELTAQNYLSTRADGHRQLHRTARLFDRWVEGYRLRLHPKLGIGSYQTDTARWWTSADAAIRKAGAQWGGETAAWHMDRHLLPAEGVLYADATPTRLLAQYRMRPPGEASANVALRRRFWNVPDWNKSVTVPSPLVYADLVASDDPRQLEAAVRLRQTDDLLRRLD